MVVDIYFYENVQVLFFDCVLQISSNFLYELIQFQLIMNTWFLSIIRKV